MVKFLDKIRRSLISKLLILIGLSLFLCVSVWAYFNIKYQKKKLMDGIVFSADTLTSTIKLGTHYAMMNNLREDINRIITKVASEKNIENIRIYNKEGQIKFSNLHGEVDQVTNIKDEACFVCHRSEPPLAQLSLAERTRIFASPQGYRLLGILSPIYSEPGCSSNSCHVHPEGKLVLGALDVVVALAETDAEILLFQKWLLGFAVLIFVLTATAVLFFILRFVKRPINNIMDETRLIANGEYYSRIEVDQEDEMGLLSMAINKMSSKIGEKQQELNKQRNEYQTLFERVPCIITVQDRDYRLIRYNREFSDKFNPRPGDYCYDAYKGRKQKCEICPVEQTFEDGRPHFSEERGLSKDGKPTHWIVNTAPIKNENGEVVAAMEMSLDVTHTKLLEEELKKSEQKYSAIFDNIPNPVFVLNIKTLEILDCNGSVASVYGYPKESIIGSSFLRLFRKEEHEYYENLIKTSTEINQARHFNGSGDPLFVNIRISPSDYPGGKVLLVTTSDITKRLETEQQLIQASKMATLGEMATGMAAEIDSYVDRANKIINHMRQFGRQSDVSLQKVCVNSVLERALEILGQQLKVRGIEVVWELTPDLPPILADPDRLEQVFINLLINARDAIDEKWQSQPHEKGEKKITLKTSTDDAVIIVEVKDTGPGIPAAMLERIFEPFFTTKKVGQGTGLGLSISYGIIKDCKGSIRAISEENEGTRFKIKFPIAREG
jgi:histidine kinase